MKMVRILLQGIVALTLLWGCASSPSTESGVVLPELMRGTGRDLSAVTAIHRAKIDTINKAVLALMGQNQYQLYEQQLKIAILNTSTPDEFIFRETLKNIKMARDGEFFVYDLEMKMNWPAIRQTLERNSVVFDGSSSGSTQASSGSAASAASDPPRNPNASRARELITGETANSSGQPTGTTTAEVTEAPGQPGVVEATAADWGESSPEEQSIIRRYVDTMTYMVYFGENQTEEPALLRAAASKANEFLAQKTMEAIDMNQIEKLKADQKTIYEESSGNDMSFIQWIAQKLNADVYVEIDATSTGRSAGNRHYGSVNMNIKLYDPSTAQLLGSVPFNSDEGFSQKSQLDAKINSLQSSIFRIMPIAIEQAKKYMVKTLTRGIKYEVIIQNTSDSRLMSKFRSALSRRVKAMNVVSSSPEETKYEVYYIGMVADLEDLIYQVTDTLPGLEGMNKVVQRGKSITLTTGL